MNKKTDTWLFAYSRWDAIPAIAGLLHFAFLIGLFLAFNRLSWWALIPLGLVYSVSISWNINGISHNFLHNPYFHSAFLNRCFSIMESLVVGFSQVFYTCVHTRHHQGNSDRPGANGDTVDWLSIYRHGHGGEPENPWSYVFLSFIRDDPKAIYREITKLDLAEASWGIIEIASLASFYILGLILNWKFMLYFFPFYYFGHCLSYLNGYYLHYGGNPDVPLAWGVSSYHRLYNWLWFNNGYHAEHHFRPQWHWTKMRELREQIKDRQRTAGTRVIKPPHALGFLDVPPPNAVAAVESRS